MASQEDDRDASVAELCFRHALRPSDGISHPILPDKEFDVGREDVRRAWGNIEPTISTHHLRFRCVMFEDDPEHEVPPLVYFRVLSFNPVKLLRSDANHSDEGSMIRRDCGDVLLNHGDALQLTPVISLTYETYAYDSDGGESALDLLRRAEAKRFANQYLVTDRILGAGGFATVFAAVKQTTGQQVACKFVPVSSNLNNTSPNRQALTAAEAKKREEELLRKRDNLAREYDVLKNLDHPNIIRLEKVFCTTYSIYIFQELITGGDLLSYMDQKGPLSEPQTTVIIRQILKAVDYLHDNQIVHRDIKPENVLMTSWRDGGRIVLTDFGQARILPGAKKDADNAAVSRMQSVVGTHGYTAPEVYQQLRRDVKNGKGYSKAIDIWSVGCITGTLLTHEFVFADMDAQTAAGGRDPIDPQLSHRPWDLSFMDYSSAWRDIGRKAKSFIRGCLTLDEDRRLTSKQALSHEWFTNKYYATEIEAAYARAIADWKPRAKVGSLIEFIDTTSVLSHHEPAQRLQNIVQDTRSYHFTAPVPPEKPAKIVDTTTSWTPLGTGVGIQRNTFTVSNEGRPGQEQTLNRTSAREARPAVPLPVLNSPARPQQSWHPPFGSSAITQFRTFASTAIQASFCDTVTDSQV